MEKLTIDFYGEKTIIPLPKDFSSLSKEISNIIQLNLPEVFSLDISYTKNKINKFIKSENDYKLFINSKVSIINLEIVELNKSLQNNLLNSGINEDKTKLEYLRKKRDEIKLKIEKKQEDVKNIINEYKPKIESLNERKTYYINKLQKDMKDQNKKEKELVSKMTKLSKEINAPLIFKIPTNGSLPFKENTPKEKEY